MTHPDEFNSLENDKENLLITDDNDNSGNEENNSFDNNINDKLTKFDEEIFLINDKNEEKNINHTYNKEIFSCNNNNKFPKIFEPKHEKNFDTKNPSNKFISKNVEVSLENKTHENLIEKKNKIYEKDLEKIKKLISENKINDKNKENFMKIEKGPKKTTAINFKF